MQPRSALVFPASPGISGQPRRTQGFRLRFHSSCITASELQKSPAVSRGDPQPPSPDLGSIRVSPLPSCPALRYRLPSMGVGASPPFLLSVTAHVSSADLRSLLLPLWPSLRLRSPGSNADTDLLQRSFRQRGWGRGRG